MVYIPLSPSVVWYNDGGFVGKKAGGWKITIQNAGHMVIHVYRKAWTGLCNIPEVMLKVVLNTILTKLSCLCTFSSVFGYHWIWQNRISLNMTKYFWISSNVLLISELVINTVKCSNFGTFVTTLYHIVLRLNNPAKKACWKHCRKRRKCW